MVEEKFKTMIQNKHNRCKNCHTDTGNKWNVDKKNNSWCVSRIYDIIDGGIDNIKCVNFCNIELIYFFVNQKHGVS